MVGRADFAQLDIGRVVTRTFSTLGGNFISFFLVGVLFGGVPAILVQLAIQQFFASDMYASMDPGMLSAMPFIIGVGTAIILLLPAYILIGAITHGAIVYLNGKRASFFECMGTGLVRVLPLFALGLLSSLGIMLGLLLFIIPGIILATRWATAAPVLVAERTGVFDALGRSAELASNNRWRIFWLMVIWVVLNYILEFAYMGILGQMSGAMLSFGENALWIYLAFYGVYSAIAAMIPAAGAAALYTELRTIKEGASTEDLAKMFD